LAIERFADDVPDAIKRLRNNMLLALQSETSRRVHSAWVGRTVGVFFSEVRAPRSNAQRISRETSRNRAENRSSVVSLPQFGASNDPSANSDREAPLGSPDSPSHMWQAIGRTSGDLICSVSAEHEGLANKMVGNIKMMRIIASEPLLLRSVASPPLD
jgi:tRNA-2-methylthio-N6-dimethylallyladenosine synthase